MEDFSSKFSTFVRVDQRRRRTFFRVEHRPIFLRFARRGAFSRSIVVTENIVFVRRIGGFFHWASSKKIIVIVQGGQKRFSTQFCGFARLNEPIGTGPERETKFTVAAGFAGFSKIEGEKKMNR